MVRHISSGSPFEARIGYSRAVVDGDTVHVSGTTGYDPETRVMPSGIAEQARNAIATIEAALIEAGSRLEDVVRVRYYLRDVADYDALVEVIGPVFGTIRPAATMIVCGLVAPEMRIEIEVTARIGAHPSP